MIETLLWIAGVWIVVILLSAAGPFLLGNLLDRCKEER